MSAASDTPAPEAYVYVIGDGSGFQKIGVSVDAERRITALQIGNPAKMVVNGRVAVSWAEARKVESYVHSLLHAKRVRREWFDVSPQEAVEAIHEAVRGTRAGTPRPKPPTVSAYPVKKLVNLTEDQAQHISRFRYGSRIKTENEAIRRLIDLGLEAEKADVPALAAEA